jgi:hypothetical protein
LQKELARAWNILLTPYWVRCDGVWFERSGEAAYTVVHPIMPGVETMGMVGGLALAANLVCFLMLYRHRGDNLNMS